MGPNAPQLAEIVGTDRDVRRDRLEALGDGAELLQGGEDDDDLRQGGSKSAGSLKRGSGTFAGVEHDAPLVEDTAAP